jgi:hypoxanthine phosphoribosyltransferase
MVDDPKPGRSGYDRGQVAASVTSGSPPRFAHDSEAELARILDFYGVAWRYEPDVFPICWNADGAVIESFAPDFYLPEIDLYVELTTLRQSLVRRKNRKLRWMRQLYPEIRVKLLYARDFRALMVKYGRIDFLSDMTATNGNGNGNGHVNGNGNGNAHVRADGADG